MLILDDFGRHPYFVRGLTAAQNRVRDSIRGLLGLAAETKVILIVTGTGVEEAALKAGSKPWEYWLVWSLRSYSSSCNSR